MQLIGMLDSPYVRRVAISLQLLNRPFSHRPLSVFSEAEAFRRLNPVVEAPSLICDDGMVLMDSTLIIEYAESVAEPGKSLMPVGIRERQRTLRLIGLALVACDKSVQIIHERNLRPVHKQYEPLLSRVTGQLLAAYAELEKEFAPIPAPANSAQINQAGVTAAVAWKFTQTLLPELVKEYAFPALQKFSTAAESLWEFKAAAHGSSTCDPSA